MSDSTLATVGKLSAIAAVSFGLNYLIQRITHPKGGQHHRKPRRTNTSKELIPRIDSYMEIMNDSQLKSEDLWGSLQLNNIGDDVLLQELEMMTRIVCPFVKVNNLIVDLQVHNPKTYPCPLVAHKTKRKHGEPFLMP
jgi:hypothetical protein